MHVGLYFCIGDLRQWVGRWQYYTSRLAPVACWAAIIIIIMTFVRHKLRHAANVPSQPLHNNSYPRTRTFSVVS